MCSSRIGQEKIGEILASSNPNEVNINTATQNSIGDKFFEMSNHLGNVLEVVTDRKLPVPDGNGNIDYFLADVVSYSDYLYDGNLKIDNNLIENKIRPIALGRKNYLFAGSHNGAKRSAMFYSFFACCKLNDIARIIHAFNFESILGTSPKGIYAYFTGLVTTNRSKLNQNLAKLLVPKFGVLKN